MRLQEFADAEEQIKLWKLISDSVWHSIKQQATEQEQKRATSQKKPSKKKPRPTTGKKPKTVSQPKLPSAQKSVAAPKLTKKSKKQLPPQAVKPQVLPLVFKNSTRSNIATPQQQSTSSSDSDECKHATAASEARSQLSRQHSASAWPTCFQWCGEEVDELMSAEKFWNRQTSCEWTKSKTWGLGILFWRIRTVLFIRNCRGV